MAKVHVDRHVLAASSREPTTAVDLQFDPAAGVLAVVVVHDGVRVIVALEPAEATQLGVSLIVGGADLARVRMAAPPPDLVTSKA